MTAESKSHAQPKKKNALLNYFEESYQELRKVSWPTRSQAVKLSFLVLGFCIATAVFIGLLDFVFSYGYQTLVNMAPAPTAVTEQNPASLQVTPVPVTQSTTVEPAPTPEPTPAQ